MQIDYLKNYKSKQLITVTSARSICEKEDYVWIKRITQFSLLICDMLSEICEISINNDFICNNNLINVNSNEKKLSTINKECHYRWDK